MHKFTLDDLNELFVFNNSEYQINDNFSYVNLSTLIMAKFEVELLDIVNFCFKQYQESQDERVTILFYSCMQNNTFSSLDILQNLYFYYDRYTLLKDVFNKFEDSYIYFPLNKLLEDSVLFLTVAALMLKNNKESARHIVNSGLNQILLADQDYTIEQQNKILDLKLTCSLYL